MIVNESKLLDLVPKYTNVLPLHMKIRFGVLFPKTLLEELDKIRGDIPRSKYLQRLVEQKLGIEN